jgi:hypothetical protein
MMKPTSINPRKLRNAKEPAVCHAIPRSESNPSKYPIKRRQKWMLGIKSGRPILGT